MAKTTPLSGPDRVLVVDMAAQGRQQFLEDMQEYRKNPIDRAPRRGGYFLDFDGQGAHDAHGNPVPMRSEDKAHAAELKARASFNRPPGEAEGDTETTPIGEAMQGRITSYPQSAIDTGVRRDLTPSGAQSDETREASARQSKAAAGKRTKRAGKSGARKSIKRAGGTKRSHRATRASEGAAAESPSQGSAEG